MYIYIYTYTYTYTYTHTAVMNSCWTLRVRDSSTFMNFKRGCEYFGLVLTLVRDEFIGCCSRRCRLGTLTITLQSALQSIWCNLVHWHCWWEYHQRSEFAIGKCHSCSNYDMGICATLWSRDSVTSWLIDRDDLQICDFGILWHPVVELWWSEHLHVLENCEFGMSWLIQPWPPSNLPSCEFGCCSWGTMAWNPCFTVWDQIGRNRYLPVPWVKVASLNKVGWFFNRWYVVSCWDQFLANRICDLFCFDRTSLNSLFWWNQNSLNGSVNWVVAVWGGVNVCFLWPWQVATSSLYWMLFCLLMMTHVSHSGSFELRLTHCDERLMSEGDKHIHSFLELTQPFKQVAQGETLWTCEELA